MMNTYRILCVFALLAVTVSQLTEKKWWQTASFYQIYPRSFQDSSGDGVGDLNGVTQRLAYLKEIGVTATWLSPILTSPMADFGYDIANFYEIDPIFGTMEDFEQMVNTAKELDIKIIMDLVPNHSSDECEWFIKSVAGDPDYEDFYIWHPGKIVNGTRQPPNNWVSVFAGPMWEWNDQRQAYYLHQFHRKQPDLNYRNPKVVEAMKDVMRFWIRKGVYGYRVDAVPHVFEIVADADGNYLDEPRNYDVTDPDNYGYTNHIYTTNQPETIELMYQFRSVLDELKAEMNDEVDRVLLLEAYTSMDIIQKYFGNGTVEGAQLPFNFALISDLTNNSVSSDYKSAITGWLDNIPEGRTSNWVIGNHDKNRVGSRLGVGRMDSMHIITATLPGCMISYNGEEIGMTDGDISWEETVDPQACQASQEELAEKSRDPERTPMQWTDDANAGFTTAAATPWLPVTNNYKLINVKNERGIPNSHLNIYKQLKTLRKSVTLVYGDTDVQSPNDNVLIIRRKLREHPTYISVLNLNKSIERINLREIYTDLPKTLEYVIATDKSLRRRRDIISSESLLLMPYEGTVLRTAL